MGMEKNVFKSICTLAFLSAATLAIAEPASTASVEAMLSAMKMESTAAANAASLGNMIRQGASQMSKDKPLTPKQKQLMEEGLTELFAIMTEEASWEKTKPIYIKSYQEMFSQEEVDAITVFYGSAAGKAMVEKQPLVDQEVLKAIMPRFATSNEKIKAHMANLVAKVKAAGDASTVELIKAAGNVKTLEMGRFCPKQVPPQMPRKALELGIEGVVKAQALIKDGAVTEVTILSGPRVYHDVVREAMMKYECSKSSEVVSGTQEFTFRVGGKSQ